MKLGYFMRGFGVGVIITVVILAIALISLILINLLMKR